MDVNAILASQIHQYGGAYAAGFIATAVSLNLAVSVPIQVVTTVDLH